MGKLSRPPFLIVVLAAAFALLVAPAVCAASALPSTSCEQEMRTGHGGKHAGAPAQIVCVFTCAALASAEPQFSTPATFATPVRFEHFSRDREGVIAVPDTPPPRR